MPEPSRSDCHAWGSHPLFHMHASLAGIRPADPGFKSVHIAPSPGPLEDIHSHIPHPDGEIRFDMFKVDGSWRVCVALPDGIEGTFVWNGQSHTVKGEQQIDLS